MSLPPLETQRELHWFTARELTDGIRAREHSVRELMEAHLAQIERVNPRVNAIVSQRDPDAVLAEADAADRRVAQGDDGLGPLHGLPIAIKDLEDTAGITTTYGHPAFADHVPDRDSLLVARLRRAGAIVIGKTNTPEFGAGSHTFNQVFGATRNPWALGRSAGGSSGGAGAALAAGLIPIADGSDHGGSIRNPAAFNNVVGLRPTPGLVPDPLGDVWDPFTVHGPLARSVPDLALMLEAIAGPERGVPFGHGDPVQFADFRPATLEGVRVAWSADLDGLPIDTDVRAVLAEARAGWVTAGAEVDDVALDLRHADAAFETLRAVGFVRAFGELPEEVRAQLKDTIQGNLMDGLTRDGAAVAEAQGTRSAVHAACAQLLGSYDVLVGPAAQVTPFPVHWEYPTEVDGVRMDSYLGWMRACTRVTVSSHPAAAAPAGFTTAGLPVGLQIVGRYGGDRRLLEIAAGWEVACGYTRRRPPMADD